MKPKPLDTAVVNHTMDKNHIRERRPNGPCCKVKVEPVEDAAIPDGVIPTSPMDAALSPRNADVIFQSLNWELHYDNNHFDCTTPSGESAITSLRKHPVVFRWHGEGKNVLLCGSFDGWKTKVPLVRSHDEMFTVVDVPLGIHQYKFLVDGRWACHPDEPQVVGDIGTPNNVISVTDSDCDAFAALEVDDSTVAAAASSAPGLGCGNCASKPPAGYGQFIPPRDTSGFNLLRHGPPLLPPHLLQSVLNTDVETHTDPTMLPSPNHVILDHTFTLSIRDGVMVLSTTHRYRQKFVTTVLYRPI